MTPHTWGPEGAPPEAYSRITDAERFAPIHSFAEHALAQLTSQYDVEREEGYDLDPNLNPSELARPTVRLTPCTQLGAPLQVSFTKFPGLSIRFGRWCREHFPACGCDACDETAGSTIENLSFVIDNVVTGHFTERVQLPPVLGTAWQVTELGDSDVGGTSRSRTRISRTKARRMLQASRARYDWKPWPRK